MAKQPRQPKYKLSTMRTLFGIIAGVTALQVPLNLFNGNTVLAVGQIVVVVVVAWYAISPPAYVRKNYLP